MSGHMSRVFNITGNMAGLADDVMNQWDIALIFAVSVMGTAVAYLRHPEHKAFVLMLPVPFTLATLALDRPIDATNVLAMGLLFGFTIGVWGLRVRLRVPILAVIPVCAFAQRFQITDSSS